MAWTAIPDKSTGDLMDETWYDTHFKANMEYLLSGRPTGSVYRTGAADYATTSNAWANVDPANLALTLNIVSGRAFLIATFRLEADTTSGSEAEADLAVDGVRAGGTHGLARLPQNRQEWVAVAALFAGLSSGSRAFTLQYRNVTNGATATIKNNGFPITLLGWEV